MSQDLVNKLMWYDNVIIDIKKRWDGFGHDSTSCDACCVSITTALGYRVDHFYNSDGKKYKSEWYSPRRDDKYYLYVTEKYEYDDVGNLIKISNHRLNGHLGTNDTDFILEFEYDNKNKIKFEILDGVKHHIQYDEDGNTFCDDAEYQRVKMYKKWGL